MRVSYFFLKPDLMRFTKEIQAVVCLVLTIMSSPFISLHAQNTNLSVGTEQIKDRAVLWQKGMAPIRDFCSQLVSNRNAFTGLNNSDDKGMLIYDLSDNKIYYWNGTGWTDAGSGGGGTNQQLSLNGNTFTLSGAPASTIPLATGAVATGQALVWDGSKWIATTLNGDVTGAHGATQVSGLKGKALPSTLPATTQALVYNGTSWVFQVLATGGGAGDLISTNNLSDVSSAATARTNLGLGTLATQSSVTGGAAGTILDNSITDADINSISTSKLTGQISNTQLADDAVTNAKIAPGANVDISKLAGGAAQNGKVLKVVGGVVSYADDEIGAAGTGDITEVNTGTGLAGGALAGAVNLSVDVGTTANKIVQLDGTGKLPAVDGSQLTNLPAGTTYTAGTAIQITGTTINNTGDTDASNDITNATTAAGDLTGTYPAPTVANGAINNAKIAAGANITIDKLNGGAPNNGKVLKVVGGVVTYADDEVGAAGTGDITDVIAGTGLAGGSATGPATLNVDVGTTANKIVQLDGTGKLPAVDGSQLTNLPAGTTYTAGTAIQITGTTINNTGDTDASNDVTNATAAAGDLTGTYPAPTIASGAVNDGKIAAGANIAINKLNGGAANNGKVLKVVGGVVTYADDEVGAAGTGDITDVIAGTGLAGGSATGPATLNVDVGTTANKIVQLDGTGRLPAVDGSQLTNLPAGTTYTAGTAIQITGTTINNTGDTDASNDITTATAAAGDLAGTYPAPTVANGVINNAKIAAGANIAIDKLNGGAANNGKVLKVVGGVVTYADDDIGVAGTGDITDVIAGTGLTGGSATGPATLNVDVGTTANKIVRLDGTGKLPAVDGSLLTNVTVAGLGNLAVLDEVTTTEIANGTILDTDINNLAGISGGKITPAFGAQNISTTGTLSVGATTLTALTVTGTTTTLNTVPYTWPAAQGAAATILTNNGTGTLSWAPAGAASGWTLTGNAGTVAGTNFLGTTDDQPLEFRTNNITTGKIDSNGPIFFGASAGSNNTGLNNTGIGSQTLNQNTTGDFNVAVGNSALSSNTTSNYNTSVGFAALSFSTGPSNTAIGSGALNFNQTGNNNTAGGYLALQANVAGSRGTAFGTSAMLFANNSSVPFENNNTAVGFESLRGSPTPSANTGNFNTAIGYQSLLSNSTGEENTATGVQALSSNTTGFINTASGFHALQSNTTGVGNTGLGKDALRFNSTGYQNTATGLSALGLNTIGDYNTATGYQALLSNVAGWGATAFGYNAMLYANNSSTPFGSGNVAVGLEALRGSINPSANTGNLNTAIGFRSLFSNSSGGLNTATGGNTLLSNTSGSLNTANGQNALRVNSTGSNNTAIGSNALTNNDTGDYNTAVGSGSLSSSNGTRNTGIGYASLGSSTTGEQNTAVGDEALFFNTNGSFNTAIGVQALLGNISGNYNTALGYEADVTSGNLTNATAIGYGATVNASDKIVLGNASATTVGGYGNFTNYSDRRLKENITYRNDLGLNFITRLRPATYNYIKDKNKRLRHGLIAQDVQEILGDLNTNFSGLVVDADADKTLNLSYADFVIPLITATQEQQQMINNLSLEKDDLKEQNLKLQEEITRLGKKQEEELSSLRKEIEEVKKLLGMEASSTTKKTN